LTFSIVKYIITSGDTMIKVTSVRHAYPEADGFIIKRDNGFKNYTFLHFYNSVEFIESGRVLKTFPHAVILYDPKTPQYFKSVGPLLHDWFHFDGDLDNIDFKSFCMNRVFYPKDYGFITKLCSLMELELFSGGSNSELLASALATELFIRLDRSVSTSEEPKIEKEVKDSFRFLRGEMLSNLNSAVSVADMARSVNLSEPRFYVLYKKMFGISPHADIIKAKIHSAKNLLQNGDLKITEIAADLGYENTTHFIRQFKSNVGLTPNEFRKCTKF